MPGVLSLLLIALIFGALYVMIAFWTVSVLVRVMSSDDTRITIAEPEQYDAFAAQTFGHEQFALERGLEWEGAYAHRQCEVAPVNIAAWRSRGAGPMIALYLLPKDVRATDIVTHYHNGARLTTSNSKGAGMLRPPSHVFLQVRPGIALEQLWAAHELADAHLQRHLGLKPVRDERPLNEQMLHAAREQAEFTTKAPYWRLRETWWFVVGKYRLRRHIPRRRLDHTGPPC